jgi:hypothetical protein
MTTAGPLSLPVVYRDGSFFGVFFRADLTRATTLLGPSGLTPWPVLGRALVLLIAFEYRDTSIGPYHEVGLAVLARRPGAQPSLLRYLRDPRAQPEQGLWVVNLPVDTEIARAGGVDVWGYPKYCTPIETRFGAEGVRVSLGDELELSCEGGGGLEQAGLPFVTMTRHDGVLVRTIVEVSSRARWSFGGKTSLRLKGDGPTAASLRTLGLDGATPLATFRDDALRATLPLGVTV